MPRIRMTFFTQPGWAALALALAACPPARGGQENAEAPPPTPVAGQPAAAPVAQALVPEGYFAAQLAEALNLGQPPDDAAAESLLSAVGIEPRNGWIADYPVTPAVIGDIEKSVAAAADSAKLGMGKEQALKLTGDVKAKLGLDIAPGAAKPAAPAISPEHAVIYKYVDKDGETHYSNEYDSIPPEYKSQATVVGKAINPPPSANPAEGGAVTPENSYPLNGDPDRINRYYDSDGPPVVTYYPPPAPYYYLYSWVPYAFWSSGLYFGGYFILHDFHRHVLTGRHAWLLSNHWAGGHGGAPGRVDPVARILAESRASSLRQFNSPAIQAHARTILGLSQNHFRPAQFSHAPPAGIARPIGAVAPGGGFPPAQGYGRGAFRPPPAQPRYAAPYSPRVYYPRTFSPSRGFSPHALGGGHYFGGRMGGSSLGGFHGGGGFGGHGGGGRH